MMVASLESAAALLLLVLFISCTNVPAMLVSSQPDMPSVPKRPGARVAPVGDEMGIISKILDKLPREPRIAIVNTAFFHMEVVAGLVEATAPFRASTTFFVHDDVLKDRGQANFNFMDIVKDVECRAMEMSNVLH